MPIFDYKCLECGNIFEKIVLKHDSTVECPVCFSDKVEKQIPTLRDSSIRITGMQRFQNNGKTRHKGDY